MVIGGNQPPCWEESMERTMWEGINNHHQLTSPLMIILKLNLLALVKPFQLMPCGQKGAVLHKQISEQTDAIVV